MLVIKGKPEIDVEKDGQIYIYRKDGKTYKIQESENASVEIDVSDLFANAVKWQWGIKTDRYWGVLLTAISFKVPHLNLNVPNILLSIKKEGQLVSINALVFAEDRDIAFRYANEFRRANRQYVAFELSTDYYENPLEVAPESLLDLLTTLDEKVEQIKQETKQVKEKTTQISEDTYQIKKSIEELKQEFIQFREEFKQFKELFNRPQEQQKQSERDIVVHKIRPQEEGLYDREGEKVYLDLLGSVFDYLEIDEKSFRNHFRTGLTEKHKEKLKQLIRKKYLSKDRFITPEEVKEIGIDTKEKENWQIQLVIKDIQLKRTVGLLHTYFASKKESIEKALRNAITQAVKEKRELTFELLAKYLGEEERKLIEKIVRAVQGKKKEMKGDVYLIADEKTGELLLKAILIEAEKQGKRVIIK